LLNDVETLVLGAIGGDATPIDRIVADTGLSIAQVLATLSVLEMRHLIRRLSGTTVMRL
jgi:DNA processing protein